MKTLLALLALLLPACATKPKPHFSVTVYQAGQLDRVYEGSAE